MIHCAHCGTRAEHVEVLRLMTGGADWIVCCEGEWAGVIHCAHCGEPQSLAHDLGYVEDGQVCCEVRHA